MIKKYMLFYKNVYKKAFTLIELLIVIALLGALAVGLLAALDPFEQLKKGADTGTRNTVSELHGAIIRYYAIKNEMPWCTANSSCATYVDGLADTVTSKQASTLTVTIGTNIVNAGELKSNFMTLGAAALPNIYVSGVNSTASVSVCYKPTAKSFINDPNSKYCQDGTVSTAKGGSGTCSTACTVTAPCYWCVQ